MLCHVDISISFLIIKNIHPKIIRFVTYLPGLFGKDLQFPIIVAEAGTIERLYFLILYFNEVGSLICRLLKVVCSLLGGPGIQRKC